MLYDIIDIAESFAVLMLRQGRRTADYRLQQQKVLTASISLKMHELLSCDGSNVLTFYNLLHQYV